MDILIGFECSGAIRDAFIRRGHNAISCDLKPCESSLGEHYQGDIFEILFSREWDLGIFHPPCTFLTNTRNRWYKPEYSNRFPTQEQDRKEAIALFMKIVEADNFKKKAIENPVGIMSRIYRKPDQIIQPYEYGHKEPKKTCLWLTNLPKLVPTKIVEPEYHVTKSGKRAPKWFFYADKKQDRAAIRSKTFQGVAEAIAEQWGSANLPTENLLF